MATTDNVAELFEVLTAILGLSPPDGRTSEKPKASLFQADLPDKRNFLNLLYRNTLQFRTRPLGVSEFAVGLQTFQFTFPAVTYQV